MKTHTTINSSTCLYPPLGLGIFSRRTLCQVVAIGLAAMLISGCSDKNKPATQIVAKVNNDEISVHQVNNALAQLPHIAPENVDKVRHDVLAKLVNQQLTVQQAINQKLDRTADVMMQIDAAKREILSRAYLSQLVAGLPKPSEEDDKKFYDGHPELFAQRRIYNLQEISLQTQQLPAAELQKMTAGKSMADIAANLKIRNIPFTSNSGTRAAEQIGLPMLVELAKLKDGQTGVIETPQLTAIVHVETSQLAPVNEEFALQRIPQYLMNEQAKVAINDNLEYLKSKAKIEYLNVSADGTHPPDTAVAQPVQTVSQPVATSGKSDNSIERGIAGIH